MGAKEVSDQWAQSVEHAMLQLWTKLASFVPNLIGTVLILIVGFVVSKILQKAASKVLEKLGFDIGSQSIGLRQLLDRTGIKLAASAIVGKLVFWLFMLTFLISAVEALGLENVSKTIDSFVAYLPNVIGAVVIFVVGLLVATFIRDVVRSAAEGIGVEYSKPLGSVVYAILFVVISSLSAGQLQIETGLINRIIEISLLATGAALAIGLGLGSRDVARHVISGVYVRDSYRPGTTVGIDKEWGTIEDVGTAVTRVKMSKGGIMYIPNGQLIEMIVREE